MKLLMPSFSGFRYSLATADLKHSKNFKGMSVTRFIYMESHWISLPFDVIINEEIEKNHVKTCACNLKVPLVAAL